jgi:hypothetical protein
LRFALFNDISLTYQKKKNIFDFEFSCLNIIKYNFKAFLSNFDVIAV